MDSLTIEYREFIEIIGSYYNNSGLDLREMVMAQHYEDGTKHLFISLDRNTYRKVSISPSTQNTMRRHTTIWQEWD